MRIFRDAHIDKNKVEEHVTMIAPAKKPPGIKRLLTCYLGIT